MNIGSIFKTLEKFTIDNSPSILTAIGVVGTISTAVLTGKASYKASEIINSETFFESAHIELSGKEKLQLVWKLYIPAVGTGVLTIVVIVGANHIGSRRAAAVAAAYSISEKAFSEYREKIVEKMGAKPEQAARDEIAQSRLDRTPMGNREIIIASGECLCFDAYSGRYFTSDMEVIKKAQNDLNYQILHNDYASVTDFYDKIGLEPTQSSDEVGWNTDHKLELNLGSHLSPDGRPCIYIGFNVVPIRDYDRFR